MKLLFAATLLLLIVYGSEELDKTIKLNATQNTFRETHPRVTKLQSIFNQPKIKNLLGKQYVKLPVITEEDEEKKMKKKTDTAKIKERKELKELKDFKCLEKKVINEMKETTDIAKIKEKQKSNAQHLEKLNQDLVKLINEMTETTDSSSNSDLSNLSTDESTPYKSKKKQNFIKENLKKVSVKKKDKQSNEKKVFMASTASKFKYFSEMPVPRKVYRKEKKKKVLEMKDEGIISIESINDEDEYKVSLNLEKDKWYTDSEDENEKD